MLDVMFLRSRLSAVTVLAVGMSLAFACSHRMLAEEKSSNSQQQGKNDSKSDKKKLTPAADDFQIRRLLQDKTAPVGPSDAAIAPHKDKFEKVVKVNFRDKPFDEVVDFVRRETGVTILIDRRFTGGLEDAVVTLEAENITLREILDWACLATYTNWDMIKGVAIVSTPAVLEKKEPVVTRFYDVSGLIRELPDFDDAPDFDLNVALSNTSSGGSSGGQIVATTLFDDSDYYRDQPTRDEAIERLTTLIQDNVGKQSDWAAYGGEVSYLREHTGSLIIRTTPSNHSEIESLLSQLAKDRETTVSVDARYYLIQSKVLDDLIKKNDGELVIAADKLEEFLKAASDPAAGTKRLGSARFAMFSGRRSYLVAANAMSFLSDVEPVAESEGFNPTQSVLISGAKVDIEATVTQGGKSIVMTFRGEVTTGKNLRQTDIPASGNRSRSAEITQSGSITGTVTPTDFEKPIGPGNPGNLDGKVTGTTTIKPAREPGAATAAALDLPDQDGVNFRTSVAIPNGGAVLMTGSSMMMKSIATDDAEIVLIIKAKSK